MLIINEDFYLKGDVRMWGYVTLQVKIVRFALKSAFTKSHKYFYIANNKVYYK